MCIFSRTVNSVRNTQIYGRLTGTGTQYLVYSMRFAASQETAMILPIPVANRDETTTIRFISLEAYPDFFGDIVRGFPHLDPRRQRKLLAGASVLSPLGVHTVGDYEASFVPTLADFSRLEERFRLPESVWEALPPQYQAYGFAVFKLSGTSHRNKGYREDRDTREVHPMAFEFATALPDTLYFPTVHVHDGRVRTVERFDHLLYYQGTDREPMTDKEFLNGKPYTATKSDPSQYQWQHVEPWGYQKGYRSREAIGDLVDTTRTQGLIDSQLPCFALSLTGFLPNSDTLIPRRIS